MASPEAVERRRIARRLRSGNLTEEERRCRVQRMLEFQQHAVLRGDIERDYVDEGYVERMLREHAIGPDQPHLVQLDYRYWVAKEYCGWDAMSKQICAVGFGQYADPAQTEFWNWWTGLHPKTRDMLVDDSAACEKRSWP